MVAAERERLTSESVIQGLLLLQRPLSRVESLQVLAHLHQELTVDDGLPLRLAAACKMLARLRNCALQTKDLEPVLDAIVAVLQRRADVGVRAASMDALAHSVSLLHTLCWCSVEVSAAIPGVLDASATAVGAESESTGTRRCLALEVEAFAHRLSAECADSVCAVLLENHADSRELTLHACGSLLLMYKFCPHIQCRLAAVAAASAVLCTFGKHAEGGDSSLHAEDLDKSQVDEQPPIAAGRAATAVGCVTYDAHVVRNACALLCAALEAERAQGDLAMLAVAAVPAVDVIWAQIKRDPFAEAMRRGGLGHRRTENEQMQVDVVEAAWRVMSVLSDERINPQGWGGVHERRRVLLLATRSLASYPDAAGVAQVTCCAVATVVRQGLHAIHVEQQVCDWMWASACVCDVFVYLYNRMMICTRERMRTCGHKQLVSSLCARLRVHQARITHACAQLRTHTHTHTHAHTCTQTHAHLHL